MSLHSYTMTGGKRKNTQERGMKRRTCTDSVEGSVQLLSIFWRETTDTDTGSVAKRENKGKW